jgi:hypothetical protein
MTQQFLQVMGLLITAGLGATVYLFRKGGPYNPMPSTDNLSTVPELPIVPASPPAALVRPVETSSTPTSVFPTLVRFCNAIAAYEGGPGDANHRNCNPGNARYNPSGYMPMYGEVKKSAAGFAIFKDWNTGMLYLQNMIKGMVHAHPDRTILQFMEVYAPSSENDPTKYAQFIARQLAVDISFPMKNLVLV